MLEANPAQGKLQQITQRMMHVVQACNDKKGIIEDKFVAVQQDLEMLECRIRTEKAKIEGEVSGVGGQVGLPQGIIEEVRAGSSILQTQDDMMVQDASSIFQGIHQYLANKSKKQVENGST